MKLQHRFSGKTCLYQDFCKTPKTYQYNSLQFPAEMNTTGSKTFFFSFLFTNYVYEGRLSVNKEIFAQLLAHIMTSNPHIA